MLSLCDLIPTLCILVLVSVGTSKRQQPFNKYVEDEVEIKQNFKNKVSLRTHTSNWECWELLDQHLSLYSTKILLKKFLGHV